MKKIIVFSAMLFVIFSVLAMPSPELSSTVSVSSDSACPDFGSIDFNGDGVLSYDEVQAWCPNLPYSVFTIMDFNGDGVLDSDEFAAGCAAGLFYGCY